MSTITERVAAGAAFLDEHEPGWDQRIDLDQLNIASSCRCMLGQLHGSFVEGLMEFRIITDYPLNAEAALGFIWDLDGSRSEPEDLTVEWKRVITERRAAS
jgi:hypothetical protein